MYFYLNELSAWCHKNARRCASKNTKDIQRYHMSFWIPIHPGQTANHCNLHMEQAIVLVSFSIKKDFNWSTTDRSGRLWDPFGVRAVSVFGSTASELIQNSSACHMSQNYNLLLLALSNRICLHIPHDDMRCTWLVSAVLSMLSWKGPCVAPCPSPLLFFCWIWENH